jgi:hypothetical protein
VERRVRRAALAADADAALAGVDRRMGFSRFARGVAAKARRVDAADAGGQRRMRERELLDVRDVRVVIDERGDGSAAAGVSSETLIPLSRLRERVG